MLPENVLRPTPAHYDASSWPGAPEPYGGAVFDLSEPQGLTRLGASIGVLQPGRLPCPLHYHHQEEEVFAVLEGELTVRELHPGADHYLEYTLGPGELVAYPPGTCIAHQSRNHSDRPVRYLALSNGRAMGEICVYPNSGKTLVRTVGIGVLGAEAGPAIAAANAAAQARVVRTLTRDQRPAHVAHTGIEARRLHEGVTGRSLSRAAGAQHVFLNADRLDPGAHSGPLHWHTRDEEILLVRSGRPILRQLREGVEERAELQPEDLVFWRPGDKVGHQLIGGSEPCEVWVIGTHRADDVTVFPEEDRVFVRVLGSGARLDPTGYFDGEA